MPRFGEITAETCPLLRDVAREFQVEPPVKRDDALVVLRRQLSDAIWSGSPRVGSGVLAVPVLTDLTTPEHVSVPL